MCSIITHKFLYNCNIYLCLERYHGEMLPIILIKANHVSGNAHHHTRNCLGDVDHGVRTFKHIYGAAQPIIDQYVARHSSLCRIYIRVTRI